MKKALAILGFVAAFFLLLKLTENSHRFSADYRLYEWSLDGERWFSLESRVPGQQDGPPFCQYVDGVQQEGNKVYVWVNGSQHPDFYLIDLEASRCTRIPGVPAHIQLVSAEQFLREH